MKDGLKHAAALAAAAAVLAYLAGRGYRLTTNYPYSLRAFTGSSATLILSVVGLAGLAWDSFLGPRHVLNWALKHVREWRRILYALVIAGQLGILMFAARAFSLENGAFNQTILLLTIGGFLVHFLVPDNLKQPTFLLVFLVGLTAVLGPADTAILLITGLALIALASLPISYGWRVAVLLAAAAGLAVLRSGLIPSPMPETVWPILSAIFMFRLIIYVIQTRSAKNRPGFLETLSYFFLLPNIVFPFFPVVDLAVFRSSRYAVDEFRIYQRGIDWMLRGFFHLVLYRVVNYYFVLGGFEIETIADLWQSMIAGYALYLRVSGQFHVIIAILHLFGYYLPETHHLYFLSYDFGEIWRRMNIYWKEFIQKTVFYPTYFRFRQLDERRKMTLATAASFGATWFLHAYQWFWLRGQFLLTWPDVLFWTILGLLVLRKNLSELGKPRSAFLSRPEITPALVLKRTLNASAVFFTMAFLWSFWDSPTIGEWLARFRFLEVTPGSVLTIGLGTLAIMTAIGVGVYFELRQHKPARLNKAPVPPARFFRHAAATAFAALVVLVLGTPRFITQTPEAVKEVLGDLRVARLSSRDRQLLERGYYEDLIGVDRFNQDLWSLYAIRPPDWVDIEMTDAVILSPDAFITYRLKPDYEIIFHNTFFETNRWGMRDQEYSQIKPDGVYRIVLVGTSRSMGSGVEQADIFETVLEDHLNREYGGVIYERYEILNMSIAGYTLLHQVLRMAEVMTFQPDLVLIETNPGTEIANTFRYMLGRQRDGVPMPDPFLDELLTASGTTARTTESAGLSQLMPYGEDLLNWMFNRIHEQVAAQGADALVLHYPSVVPEEHIEDLDVLFGAAREAGVEVLDLSSVFSGIDANSLIVAPWDYHPNDAAHHLLAEALFEALTLERRIPIP